MLIFNIFNLVLFTFHKIRTMLIYNFCAFWSLTFRCVLIEPYMLFDHNYHSYLLL